MLKLDWVFFIMDLIEILFNCKVWNCQIKSTIQCTNTNDKKRVINRNECLWWIFGIVHFSNRLKLHCRYEFYGVEGCHLCTEIKELSSFLLLTSKWKIMFDCICWGSTSQSVVVHFQVIVFVFRILTLVLRKLCLDGENKFFEGEVF